MVILSVVFAAALSAPLPVDKPDPPALPDMDQTTPTPAPDRTRIILGFKDYPDCTLEVDPSAVFGLYAMGFSKWASRCKTYYEGLHDE